MPAPRILLLHPRDEFPKDGDVCSCCGAQALPRRPIEREPRDRTHERSRHRAPITLTRSQTDPVAEHLAVGAALRDDRAKCGHERTNTNSAFYPFRGGMTHVVHPRGSRQMSAFGYPLETLGVGRKRGATRSRPRQLSTDRS